MDRGSCSTGCLIYVTRQQGHCSGEGSVLGFMARLTDLQQYHISFSIHDKRSEVVFYKDNRGGG